MDCREEALPSLDEGECLEDEPLPSLGCGELDDLPLSYLEPANGKASLTEERALTGEASLLGDLVSLTGEVFVVLELVDSFVGGVTGEISLLGEPLDSLVGVVASFAAATGEDTGVWASLAGEVSLMTLGDVVPLLSLTGEATSGDVFLPTSLLGLNASFAAVVTWTGDTAAWTGPGDAAPLPSVVGEAFLGASLLGLNASLAAVITWTGETALRGEESLITFEGDGEAFLPTSLPGLNANLAAVTTCTGVMASLTGEIDFVGDLLSLVGESSLPTSLLGLIANLAAAIGVRIWMGETLFLAVGDLMGDLLRLLLKSLTGDVLFKCLMGEILFLGETLFLNSFVGDKSVLVGETTFLPSPVRQIIFFISLAGGVTGEILLVVREVGDIFSAFLSEREDIVVSTGEVLFVGSSVWASCEVLFGTIVAENLGLLDRSRDNFFIGGIEEDGPLLDNLGGKLFVGFEEDCADSSREPFALSCSTLDCLGEEIIVASAEVAFSRDIFTGTTEEDETLLDVLALFVAAAAEDGSFGFSTRELFTSDDEVLRGCLTFFLETATGVRPI